MVGPARVISEFHQYISPDAITYDFHTATKYGRWVMSSTGWGIPPIDYITQMGPFQHGATPRDLFLKPRVIQLIIEQNFCNRDDYWVGRANLLNHIRPNRQAIATAMVPGQLRRLLSNGSVRDLDVFIRQGPQFEQQLGKWKEWGFRELLQFIAFNPVVYDPTQEAQANWNIPVGNVDDTQNVTYLGTWEEYPCLIITGPLNNPIINNNTTGEVIDLNYNIPAGRVVTITLTYGLKTVVDDLGNNLIGTVTVVSDLATFHLAPDPEAALGVNAIRLRGTLATAATDFEIQWHTRYIGI